MADQENFEEDLFADLYVAFLRQQHAAPPQHTDLVLVTRITTLQNHNQHLNPPLPLLLLSLPNPKRRRLRSRIPSNMMLDMMP